MHQSTMSPGSPLNPNIHTQQPYQQDRSATGRDRKPKGKHALKKLRGSCDNCAAAKVKCHKGNPCARCRRHGEECVYGVSMKHGRRSQKKARTAWSTLQDRLAYLTPPSGVFGGLIINTQNTSDSEASLWSPTDTWDLNTPISLSSVSHEHSMPDAEGLPWVSTGGYAISNCMPNINDLSYGAHIESTLQDMAASGKYGPMQAPIQDAFDPMLVESMNHRMDRIDHSCFSLLQSALESVSLQLDLSGSRRPSLQHASKGFEHAHHASANELAEILRRSHDAMSKIGDTLNCSCTRSAPDIMLLYTSIITRIIYLHRKGAGLDVQPSFTPNCIASRLGADRDSPPQRSDCPPNATHPLSEPILFGNFASDLENQNSMRLFLLLDSLQKLHRLVDKFGQMCQYNDLTPAGRGQFQHTLNTQLRSELDRAYEDIVNSDPSFAFANRSFGITT